MLNHQHSMALPGQSYGRVVVARSARIILLTDEPMQKAASISPRCISSIVGRNRHMGDCLQLTA